MKEEIFFNKIKFAIKKHYLDKGKTIETFTSDMLFSICCQMCQNGYEVISLRNKDTKYYAKKLDYLFNRFEIYSDYFCMTPVTETYDGIKNFFIDYIYAQNYGIFSSNYDYITLNINDYMISKTLKKYSDFSAFIHEGYCIMTDQDYLSIISTSNTCYPHSNKEIKKH